MVWEVELEEREREMDRRIILFSLFPPVLDFASHLCLPISVFVRWSSPICSILKFNAFILPSLLKNYSCTRNGVVFYRLPFWDHFFLQKILFWHLYFVKFWRRHIVVWIWKSFLLQLSTITFYGLNHVLVIKEGTNQFSSCFVSLHGPPMLLQLLQKNNQSIVHVESIFLRSSLTSMSSILHNLWISLSEASKAFPELLGDAVLASNIGDI